MLRELWPAKVYSECLFTFKPGIDAVGVRVVDSEGYFESVIQVFRKDWDDRSRDDRMSHIASLIARIP